MLFDGPLGDPEPAGDAGVGAASATSDSTLALAFGERGERS
jgi:hypothetical protein